VTNTVHFYVSVKRYTLMHNLHTVRKIPNGSLVMLARYIYIYTQNYLRILRHCATSRKAAGSIPDGVTVIFH